MYKFTYIYDGREYFEFFINKRKMQNRIRQLIETLIMETEFEIDLQIKILIDSMDGTNL